MNELRKEIAIQQKKGLPFIMTSVIIWLLILLVSILDINMNMKNLLVFCCSCPLLPLSWIIGKLIKVDIFSKENPLGQLGFIFTLNQMIYLLIVRSSSNCSAFFDSLDSFIYITSFPYLLFQFSNSVFCFSNKLFSLFRFCANFCHC